jgi:DNA-binding LacI/PurR family transcriptional regulator
VRLKNKDIAQMLGISVTAVSLAINGKPGVSDETRRKVLALVADSNQRALEDALSKAKKPGNVVFVIHKAHGAVINGNQFFSILIEVVQDEAQRRGFSLTIAHYRPGQDMEAHLNYVRSLQADGLLLQATELDEAALQRYLSLGLPTVLLDGYFDLTPVEAVTLDDQAAFYRVLAYAVKRGHFDIGFLAGTPRIKNFEHHLDGFWKGVRDFGLEGANHPVIELGCTFEDARRDMAAFLAKPPKSFRMPTCLLADLDNIALGAMRALKDAGYAIPDDVSVIGYGNTDVAAISEPPLTTTQIEMRESGRMAMGLLADRMRNPHKAALATTMLASRLVERDSVRDLRATATA